MGGGVKSEIRVDDLGGGGEGEGEGPLKREKKLKSRDLHKSLNFKETIIVQVLNIGSKVILHILHAGFDICFVL